MRILIAEDDPVIGLGLSERLRVLGHEPIGPVADGQLAVEAARASLPDLYLFDIDMPRLDGPKRTLPSTAGQLLLASGRSTRRDALKRVDRVGAKPRDIPPPPAIDCCRPFP
ncbi:MAG TPA: response regulator [Gaiellaceae bacterium]